jgi:hypothetical protein
MRTAQQVVLGKTASLADFAVRLHRYILDRWGCGSIHQFTMARREGNPQQLPLPLAPPATYIGS